MAPLRRRSRGLTGSLAMPGDKSISHRAVLVAALARGGSDVRGLNEGEDVARTVRCIALLGADPHERQDSPRLEVEGYGTRALREPDDVLDAGNSGSTARMILGVVAGVPGCSVITGDASLRRRPMLRVVAPLRTMGATIDGRAHADRLPLLVRGGQLHGYDHELAVASAQVKSALLLAGLGADGTTSVTEPYPSRDHTERMLRAAGIELVASDGTVSVRGPQEPQPRRWDVPGDVSSATFFVVAAALVPGSDLTLTDVGLNPTRTGGLDVLRDMGADISIAIEDDEWEPRGTVSTRTSGLRAVDVPAEAAARLIDEVPVLAVAASQAEGASIFRGVGELRAKESDRLATIVEGLRALGADAEVHGDDLVVEGPRPLSGGAIDPHADHRIAMAFGIAGLVAADRVRVSGWSCVDTSFPSFLDLLVAARPRS